MRFGSGENVILLHGWGGDKNSLIQLAEGLSFEYTVTVVDLYGFGDTPHPPHPINLNDYADGVFGLVKKYNMNSVILIGHSFGGKVALSFVLRYPTFVKKLVLIDSSGMKPRKSALRFVKKTINKVFVRLHKTPPFASPDYKATGGDMRRTFVGIVNTHLDGNVKDIRAKTLMVWGAKDRETPPYMAKRLNKKISNSKLCVIDGVGHFPFIDKPTLVMRAIKEFLGEE